jgi:hypothetical protein
LVARDRPSKGLREGRGKNKEERVETSERV